MSYVSLGDSRVVVIVVVGFKRSCFSFLFFVDEIVMSSLGRVTKGFFQSLVMGVG